MQISSITNNKDIIAKYLKSNNIPFFYQDTMVYGVFRKYNKLVQLVSFAPPINIKNFQWEIVDEHHVDENYLSEIFEVFCKNNTVHSCYCQMDEYKDVLKDSRFKRFGRGYSYFPFSVVYMIEDESSADEERRSKKI